MSQITLVWTALPNGLTGDVANRRLRLSAYVSMRLTTDDGADGTLAAFLDALNWPSLLQPGTFSVAVSGNGGVGTPATVVSPPPDLQLWQDLFLATARVVSHAPDDLTGRPFNTYQAGAVHDEVRAGHQRLSQTSPVALPTRRQLIDALPDLHGAFGPAVGPVLPAVPVAELRSHAELTEFQSLAARDLLRPSSGNGVHRNMALLAAAARQLAANAAPGSPVLLIPDDGTPEAKFKQLYAFHHREPIDPKNPPPLPVPPDPASVLDFHQALSALAQYPELLRKLGLVIDLEVPEASLPQSPLSAGSGRVQVVPTFTAAPALTNLSPLTAYILDGDRLFTSASQNPAQPETIAGLINLALPEGYTLIQADVDSMGLKTLNMAASNTLSTSDGDGDAGTPAPRGPGISLARTNHAAVLAQRFATAAQNNQNVRLQQTVTLFAEDLTRGLRFDVLNESNVWRSLHARTGSYVFLNHPGGPLTLQLSDEGFGQPTATNRVDGSEDVQAQLFVHDSLLHWKGWSLAAPRPGKAIGKEGPATITNRATDKGIPLEVNFVSQPGTLPRLRFHHRYQVRARAVDLAGNSISVAEADDVLNNLLPVLNRPAPVLPPNVNDFTFRRFEPVSAPHLVSRERVTEGESAARQVIRSNVGEGVTACSSRLMALVAASRPQDRVIYTATNDRHIVPPKTSQLAAEMHELFDSSFGATGTFLTTYNLARKEKGRLTDTAIIDTATGSPVPIPDTTGVDPLTGNPVTRAAVEFVATGGKNGYAVHHEPLLQLPYLPDLLSRGATLCGLPGVSPGQAGVLDPSGNLTFVNSTLPPQNIGPLVSTTQIGFGGSWPGYLPFRLQLAEPSNPNGPSELPSWDADNRVLILHLAKAETQTIRLSSFLNPNDLDVLGIWQWILERKAAQGLPPPDAGDAQTAIEGCMWMLTPFLDIELVHAVQQPLKVPALQSLITPRDFEATFAYIGAAVAVHGKSTARLELAASWQENVDDPSKSGPAVRSVKAHVYDFDIHLPSSGPVPEQPGIMPVGTYDANGDTVTFNAPVGDPQGRTFLSRQEFGDTKHRTVSYKLTATTRFREYFPPEVTNTPANITQIGPEVTVEVPSSARPAAPDVRYAVPMFEWIRTVNSDGSQVRIRKGGGIRIYVGRPWYSSGDGEMLAAVLAQPGDYPPDDAHRNLVTHWGNDPAYLTDALALPPQVTDFPLATETPGLLSLVERDDRAVGAAAHPVEFNADRELWFCDMRVNSGTVYSPFIRLALARYQKNAISGTELSRVVLTDFLQLLPDRTVKVNPVAGDPNSFTISVEGISYRANAWNTEPIGGLSDGIIITPRHPLSAPFLIHVSLEQRISGTSDEAGWQVFGDGSNVTAVTAVGAENPEGTLLWSGKVSLPPARTAGQFRVVIREQEQLLTDERIVKTVTARIPHDPDLPPGHGPILTTFPLELTFTPGGPRLVFAETIEI